jgi:hypothetical protein
LDFPLTPVTAMDRGLKISSMLDTISFEFFIENALAMFRIKWN